jgi:hypothetical protein
MSKMTSGFQKPLDDGKRKKVGLASVRDDDGIGAAQCSCGWAYAHRRAKVRENAIQRHLDRAHAGRGIWL